MVAQVVALRLAPSGAPSEAGACPLFYENALAMSLHSSSMHVACDLDARSLPWGPSTHLCTVLACAAQ